MPKKIFEFTGGCSESNGSFFGKVIENFVQVEKFSIIKTLLSLSFSGAITETYGGLTIGRALIGLYRETRTGLQITGIGYRSFTQVLGTVAGTTPIDGVLIGGMYYAGALFGSALRVSINRLAKSSCECSQ